MLITSSKGLSIFTTKKYWSVDQPGPRDPSASKNPRSNKFQSPAAILLSPNGGAQWVRVIVCMVGNCFVNPARVEKNCNDFANSWVDDINREKVSAEVTTSVSLSRNITRIGNAVHWALFVRREGSLQGPILHDICLWPMKIFHISIGFHFLSFLDQSESLK